MISTDPIITRIVIRRNQSLSWQGLGLILAGGFALTLAIGLLVGIAAGWWPIAAYEGGVFTLFALILSGLTANRAKEIVSIRERTVTVEYGRRRAEMRIEMDRYWARVEECSSPRPALIIRSRGVAVEIARALDDDARAALASRLRELLGPAGIGRAARISDPMPGGQL
ncbi:MAG TPA: DUF2244 domain-containing protein [Gammaproteobacteria bacterium]|nr:DUF2244 domain-containing protein [Gammaproteobacteria bacterium]